MSVTVTSRPFGVCKGGQPVTCFRLENRGGMAVELLDYGCRLRAVYPPAATGVSQSVLLGFASIGEYEADTTYQGALVGRHAGRIQGGRFSLHGKAVQLPVNQPPNHLHGGVSGFDRKMWDAAVLPGAVRLHLTSPDGEEGYPGRLEVTVTYTLSEDDVLTLHYHAVADADTVVSLTSHGYWNLSGAEPPLRPCLSAHSAQISADLFAEIDKNGLPTGCLTPVEHTPFDFRTPRSLGCGWDADHPQILAGNGYDHSFLLPGTGLRPAVTLAAAGGLTLSVATDLPAVHLYSGNFLEHPRTGLAIECQFLPNSLACTAFPSAVLPSGTVWNHCTTYRLHR